MTEVLPPLALCRVWCTSQAAAGWSHRPAHWQCWSRRITALRIPAGIDSEYPMSSGRLGPPSRAPSCRRRRNEASARVGQQVDRGADDGLLERLPGGAGARAGGARRAAGARVRVAVAAAAEPAELGAQPDQVLQRGGVHLPGHDRGHRRVARDARGSVPVQPRPAIAPAFRCGGTARGPGRADLRGPLLLQRRAAIQPEQVRQRDVRPDLDRLTGPPGQQPGRGQAAHAFIEKMHRELGRIFMIRSRKSVSTFSADGSSDNTSPSTMVQYPTTHAADATRRACLVSPRHQRLGRRRQRLLVRVGDGASHGLGLGCHRGGLLMLAGPGQRPGHRRQGLSLPDSASAPVTAARASTCWYASVMKWATVSACACWPDSASAPATAAQYR